MFRLLSRQAVKAVPRPRAGLRLSNGTTLRDVHSMQPPYTGPPSYDTIARRFSPQVNPEAYFTRKRQQEAKERGEYVDIHDIGGTDPEDYDVLITDIKHETLKTLIAEEVGIPYLSKATEAEVKAVVKVGGGYIHGMKDRVIVPFAVGHEDEARWVFFILDSGAPLTYLSDQTRDILGIPESAMGAPVTIGGYDHYAYTAPVGAHFSDINLLGADFCRGHGITVLLEYQRRLVKLYFGGKWKMVEESKL